VGKGPERGSAVGDRDGVRVLLARWGGTGLAGSPGCRLAARRLEWLLNNSLHTGLE